MKSMTAAEIEEYFGPFVQDKGLSVLSVKAEPVDEPPFDEIPLVNVRVSLEGTTTKEVFEVMESIGSALSGDLRDGVRTGLYYRDLGYEDIPVGEALLQFDNLNIQLKPEAAAPKM